MKRLSKVRPLFLNHAPVQARGEDRPRHQVEVPLVILRRNRFPSRHGDCDLVRSIYAYVCGNPRTPFEGVVRNATFRSVDRTAAIVPFTERWTGGTWTQPRISPGSWVVRNRIVRSQAILAAPRLYASGRSFSKNQCVVPAYLWNVNTFPSVRRSFSRSCTEAADSNSSVSAK